LGSHLLRVKSKLGSGRIRAYLYTGLNLVHKKRILWDLELEIRLKNIQPHTFFRKTTILQYFVAILERLKFMKKQKKSYSFKFFYYLWCYFINACSDRPNFHEILLAKEFLTPPGFEPVPVGSKVSYLIRPKKSHTFLKKREISGAKLKKVDFYWLLCQ